MRRRILVMLGLWLAVAQVAAAAPAKRHETGFLDRSVVVQGVEYRYTVYVPRDFDPNRKWPVVLTLHGGGEYGSDGIGITAGSFAQTIRRRPEQMPAIVVFAQAHADGTPGWQRQGGEAALKAVDSAVAEFHGDLARIYLTGFSAGGNGAWFLAFHEPKRFAAMIVASGFVSDFTGVQSHLFYPAIVGMGPDRFDIVARQLKDLPIWIVHGDADKNVSVEESRHMAAALAALKADVRYTELPGVDHNGAGQRAFADPEIAAWLLAQRRR